MASQARTVAAKKPAPGRLTASSRLKKPVRRSPVPASGAKLARRKFLTFYPGAFKDSDYVSLERDYKWQAHQRWQGELGQAEMRRLIRAGEHATIAARAVAIESRTNLLFSFEKMALRDGVKTQEGAETFATGLYDFLHGDAALGDRFERWCEVIGSLPRRQTRVLTWPVVTVFGFIAQPATHLYFKPMVTKAAAASYGYPFEYRSKPQWETYCRLLAFARAVKSDVSDMRPRDMIDIQSFIWVQGSDEYET